MVSCYEAGGDGLRLHRYLRGIGVENTPAIADFREVGLEIAIRCDALLQRVGRFAELIAVAYGAAHHRPDPGLHGGVDADGDREIAHDSDPRPAAGFDVGSRHRVDSRHGGRPDTVGDVRGVLGRRRCGRGAERATGEVHVRSAEAGVP